MNDRDVFSQYVEMINRFEYVSNKGNTIHPSENDNKLMKIVHGMASSNDHYKALLKKLHSLPPRERYKYLEDSFNKKNVDENLVVSEKKEIEKGFQFIKKDKKGYIDNALYFSVASSVILLVAIIIALFYYYIS